MAAPEVPCGQQVEARAEAEFADAEAAASGPGAREPAASEEDGTLFGQTFAREIDVVVVA